MIDNEKLCPRCQKWWIRNGGAVCLACRDDYLQGLEAAVAAADALVDILDGDAPGGVATQHRALAAYYRARAAVDVVNGAPIRPVAAPDALDQLTARVARLERVVTELAATDRVDRSVATVVRP